MKDIIEKLEQVEEVLQIMVNKMTLIGNKEAAFPEIKIPDYSQDLKGIKERLNGLPDKSALEKLNETLVSLGQQIKKMPAEIPVRHHHHFDARSKGFIIGGISLLIVTAITAGLSLSLWSENQLLHKNSLEFRMIRVADLAIAAWADSTYYRNTEEAERLTEQYETLGVPKHQAEDSAKHKGQTTKQSGKTNAKLNEK